MSNNDNDKLEFDYLLSYILSGASLVLSFFFILILKKKESNYARIVRHIVMTEGIYIFCFLGIIIRGQDNFLCFLNYIRTFSRNTINNLTFKLFEDHKEDKDDQSFFKLMDILNLAMYYSMEAFSLTFSIFICLELILILRNPIAQMKSRFKPYFIFSFFLSIITFVMICTIDLPDATKTISVEDYLFYDSFQM